MVTSTSVQSIVEEIKSKTDIVDLVGSYVNLKKAGKYFKANCPFHEEKTPSFVVSPEIQRWHCFGACHEGGDVITFVMKWENIPFSEALKLLAQRSGINITDKLERSGFADSESEKRSKLLEINELSAKYYAYILKSHAIGSQARAYLETRGLPVGIADKFMIGFAPTGWDSLVGYLRKKGYKNEDIVSSGLAISTSRGAIDRFRGRLIFPIMNTLGKVIGFSGRLLGGVEPTEKTGAKYVNTPETLLYHKRESLYGFTFSKDAVRKENAAIIVEGEFDFLTPYTKGIENIVAIKGSAFTREQLKILKRYCDRLVLALDNDKAGQDALRRSIIEAAPFGFDVYVCEMPGGKDPDEAAREHLAEFKKMVSNPTPVFDYLFASFSRDVKLDDPYSKKIFTSKMAEFLVHTDNPVVRDHYIKKIAEYVSTSINSIDEVVKNARIQKPKITKQELESAGHDSQKTKIQKELIGALFRTGDSEVAKKVREILTGKEFDTALFVKLYDVWTKQAAGRLPVDVKSCISMLPDEYRSKAEELYLMSSMSTHSDGVHEKKEVLRLALTLKKLYALALIQGKGEQRDEDATLALASEILKSVEKELQIL